MAAGATATAATAGAQPTPECAPRSQCAETWEKAVRTMHTPQGCEFIGVVSAMGASTLGVGPFCKGFSLGDQICMMEYDDVHHRLTLFMSICRDIVCRCSGAPRAGSVDRIHFCLLPDFRLLHQPVCVFHHSRCALLGHLVPAGPQCKISYLPT